jgi:hypothetical protein
MAHEHNTPVVVQNGGGSGVGAVLAVVIVAVVLVFALIWWSPWHVSTGPQTPQAPSDVNIHGDININPPSSTAP